MMDYAAFEAAVDKAVGAVIGSNTPGCSLLIAKDGQVLLRKGYGMADLEKGIPVKSEDNFIIASNTKQFTCLSILMLRDRGLLDLDETIERFFPDFPEYRKTVTVRMLMSHTSGIREYFEEGFRENEDALRVADTAALLEIGKNFGGLQFESETQWSYCNTAYVMLGDIVRQLTGKPFGQFLTEEVLIPLGMTNTMAPDFMDQVDPRQVVGYSEENGSFVPQPYDMLEVGYADGNMSSNVDDLLKWHHFLYETDGTLLLNKGSKEELFRNHQLLDGTYTNYGLGLFLGNSIGGHSKSYDGHGEIWHTGGSMGFISRMSRFTDKNITAITLTNWHGITQDDIFHPIMDAVYQYVD